MRSTKRLGLRGPSKNAGTPFSRFEWLQKEVEKRFPNPNPLLSSIPPEAACIAQMDIERAKIVDLLEEAIVAIDDCACIYAPEMCNDKHVSEAQERIKENGGTLYYMSKVIDKLSCTINNLKEKHVN